MRILRSLVSVLLLSTAISPLLLTAVASAGVLLIAQEQAQAQAQSAEAVAKTAQAITVRIEGATQGSGVLVKRDGNHYTVLTAWHVVSGQKKGEELYIYTPDGKRHPVEQGGNKRLGEVDMGIVKFISEQNYELASVSTNKLYNDQVVYISGFPLDGDGRLRVETAQLIWTNTFGLGNGYKILSKGFTKGGMSGGPLLNSDGFVVGIHGRGERAKMWSREIGKTGINQSMPINYLHLSSTGNAIEELLPPSYSDEFLIKIQNIANGGRLSKESIELIASYSSESIKNKKNSEAYFYRAYARNTLGDPQGAISDYRASIDIGTDNGNAFKNLGYILWQTGDLRESCRYLRVASALGSQAANELMGTEGGGPCTGEKVQFLNCSDVGNMKICK